jgi:hypothetical protein
VQLQRAPRIFLDEQLRQALPARRRAHLQISPRDDIFLPAISLPVDTFNKVADAFASGLGLRSIKIFDFQGTLARLLRPSRVEALPIEAAVTPDEFLDDLLDAVAPEYLSYAQEALSACRATPRRISELLNESPSPEAAELLRLLALMLFDHGGLTPDAAALPGVDEDLLGGLRAELVEELFEAAGYRGDDLLISPAPNDQPIEQWGFSATLTQERVYA